jgi:beta-fructofuranosidase
MSPDNVWVNISARVNMMECPDLFPLGNKWMMIASLYVNNQWWIGHLVGNPPIFVPENTGLLDYGNYYAARTGTDIENGPNSRRIMFSFDGWTQATADPECGHSMTLPREITLGSDQLSPRINPLPEARDLRIASSHQSHTGPFTTFDFPPGSHIEINAVCLISGPIIAGRFIMRVLGDADGSHYTDIGFDFYENALFVNVHKCCAVPNFLEQQAPLVGPLEPMNTLNMTVFIDGQIIETFVNGLVTLTTLVSPDIRDGLPSARTNTIINAAGPSLQCNVDFWSLVSMID